MLLRRFITRRLILTAVASAFTVNIAIVYNRNSACESHTVPNPILVSDSSASSSAFVVEIIRKKDESVLNLLKLWSNWMSDLSSIYHDFYHSSFVIVKDVFIIVCRSCYLTFLFTPNILLSPFFYFLSTTFTNTSGNSTLHYISTHYQSLWWNLLKESIRKSGPCLTKFAQWIVTRPDLFPLELCRQFQDLQSNQQFMPYTHKQVMDILKKEYESRKKNQSNTAMTPRNSNSDMNPSAASSSISFIDNLTLDTRDDDTQSVITLGAGCVAQVVKGSLSIPSKTTSTSHSINKQEIITDVSTIPKKANEHKNVTTSSKSIPVAIKIVHPDIKAMVESDIIIMNYSTTLFENLFPQFRAFSMSDSVSEFSSLLLSQLDLIQEARNLDQFRQNFHILDENSEGMNNNRVGNIKFPRHLDYEEINEFVNSVNIRINYSVHQIKRKYKKFIKTIKSATTLENINPSNTTIDDNDDDNEMYVNDNINSSISYPDCNILFPKPYHEYCTQNVLVEDYVQGVLMSDVIDQIYSAEKNDEVSTAIKNNIDTSTMIAKDVKNDIALIDKNTGSTDSVDKFKPSISQSKTSQLSMLETRKQLARLGLDAILKMVFEDNFIHADLHPGNIICQDITPTTNNTNSNTSSNGGESKKKYRLVMIDAGLTASLSRQDRRNFIDVFDAIIHNDGARVGQLMMDRSRNNPISNSGGSSNSTSSSSSHKSDKSAHNAKNTHGDGNSQIAGVNRNISHTTTTSTTSTCLRPEEFKQILQNLVSEVHLEGLSLKNISVGSLLQTLLVACYIHQVKLEAKFVSLILAIGVLEGLGRRLDPDVDILRQAAPYVMKAALREALTRDAQESKE